MKLFFDTDVLLDVTLNRADCDVTVQVIARARKNNFVTCTSSICIANIYYITRKLLSRKSAESAVQFWLEEMDILTPGKSQLIQATALGFNDWEDAVQLVTARSKNCTHVVTRNGKDYAKASEIQVIDPKDMLILLVNKST